jgi:tyrosyl-tRNA synthetase
MMAKDSVQNRLKTGLSFTEFSYQLVQGYDFCHLYKEKNCKLQMGGSDQWGNILTGTELIRRKLQGSAFAITAPLITKADGSKFGKSEGGNVWLDKNKTSVYKFYQFWLNTSDEDAEKYIKIFTFKNKEEIDILINAHREDPGRRLLQKELAKEVTCLVHSEEEYETAVEASNILFGRATSATLAKLSEEDFVDIFNNVPQKEIPEIVGKNIIELLASETGFLASNGEAKRDLKGNAISVNKDKVTEEFIAQENDLIAGKYLLLQKGKKNYFIVKKG